VEDSVYPIVFDGEGSYVPSEIEKADKSLHGVYAIFKEGATDNDGRRHQRWIYLGCGNIYQGLKDFLQDPCYFDYLPDMFAYIKHPNNPESKLAEVKAGLTQQLCKHRP